MASSGASLLPAANILLLEPLHITLTPGMCHMALMAACLIVLLLYIQAFTQAQCLDTYI